MDSNQTEMKRGDSGHTPETWIVARTMSGHGYSVHVTNTKYEIVASVGTHDFNVSNPHNPAKGFDSAQINANALLISAAPDLLAACEGLLRMFNELNPPGSGFSAYEKHAETARAAIAKAKGGVA